MVQMDKKEDVQKLTKSGKDDYVRKEDPVQKQTPAPKAVDTKNQFMSQLQIMNGDEEDSDDDDEDTKMWIKEKSEPSKKNSPIKKSPIKSSPVKELKKPTPEPVVVDNKKTIEYQIQKTPTKQNPQNQDSDKKRPWKKIEPANQNTRNFNKKDGMNTKKTEEHKPNQFYNSNKTQKQVEKPSNTKKEIGIIKSNPVGGIMARVGVSDQEEDSDEGNMDVYNEFIINPIQKMRDEEEEIKLKAQRERDLRSMIDLNKGVEKMTNIIKKTSIHQQTEQFKTM